MRTTRSTFPKMRAPVETWTIASRPAALASQTFAAIADEKTDVRMSVYVDETLASMPGDPTRYDRFVFGTLPRRVRLIGIPIVLFGAFAGTAFGLAELHPAKPSVPSVSGGVKLGDPYRGQISFGQKCASCH